MQVPIDPSRSPMLDIHVSGPGGSPEATAPTDREGGPVGRPLARGLAGGQSPDYLVEGDLEGT